MALSKVMVRLKSGSVNKVQWLFNSVDYVL